MVGGHLEKFIKSHAADVIYEGGGEAFEVCERKKIKSKK